MPASPSAGRRRRGRAAYCAWLRESGDEDGWVERPDTGGARMKYVDEYRDARLAERLLGRIRRAATRPWTIMEVCGGQTHTLVRSGHRSPACPSGLRLVHGPGCPVCVTPLEQIDRALAHRAPAGRDLLLVRRHAAGPRQRRRPARACAPRAATCGSSTRRSTPCAWPASEPERQVVFFAVGFETTAPADGAGGPARRGGWVCELLDAGLARPRPAGDGGDPRRRRATACRASSPPATSAR